MPVQSPNLEPPPVVRLDDNKQAGDGADPPPVTLKKGKTDWAGLFTNKAKPTTPPVAAVPKLPPGGTPKEEQHSMRLKWVRSKSAPGPVGLPKKPQPAKKAGKLKKKKLRPSPVQIPSLHNLNRPAPPAEFSPARGSPLSHRMSPVNTGRFSPMTTGRMTPPGGRSAGGTLRNLGGGSSPGGPIFGTGLATPPSRGYTNKKSKLSATVCPGHTRPIVNLQYTQPTEMGSLLLSACLDGIPMFRYDNGDWIGSFLGHKGGVWCARANRAKHASEAATLVITGSADYCARLWDGQNGSALSSFKHESIVRACDFSEDGESFFTGGKEKLLRMFDISKREEMWQGESEKEISGLVPLSESNLVLTHSTDASIVQLWDVRAKKCVRTLDLPYKVQAIQRDAPGKVLTVCAGLEVSFWDLEKFEKTDALAVDTDKGNLAIASTNTELELCVTAQEDSTTVDVWKYKEGKHMCSLRGHHGEVQAIAWEPSGKNFATGARDAAIRVWQVEGTDLDERSTPTGKAFFEKRAKQRSVLDAFASAQTGAGLLAGKPKIPMPMPSAKPPGVGGPTSTTGVPTATNTANHPTTGGAGGGKKQPMTAFMPAAAVAKEFVPSAGMTGSALSSGAKAFVPNTAAEAFVPNAEPASTATQKFIPKPDAKAFVPKSPGLLSSAAKEFVPSAATAKEFIPKPTAKEFIPSPQAKPFVPSSSPSRLGAFLDKGLPAMPDSPPAMPLSGPEIPEMPLSDAGSASPPPPDHRHLLGHARCSLDSPPGSPSPPCSGPAGGPPDSPPLSGIGHPPATP